MRNPLRQARIASGILLFAGGAWLASPAAAQGQIAPEIPSPAPAEDRLTLRQAVDIGLRDNPQTTSATYSVESAHENLNSQRAPINPTIEYAAVNNTVAPADINGFGQATNYSAYLTLETNGALHWRTAQAREQFHQAQFDASTTRLTLKQSIINAYVNLQIADKALEIEQQVYDNARQLSDLTSKQFQLGASAESDAIRARIAFVQEEQNLLTAAAGVRSARAMLNSELGHPVGAPIDTAEALEYKPITLPEIAVLGQMAARNRPEIASADANLQALKAAKGLAGTEYYPNVIVARDFASGSPVNVGLAVPIDLGSIRGAVKKAQADVKVEEAQAQFARQNVDLDVQSSYINLVSAQKQVDSYESGILHQSETLLSQLKQGYTLGASTILDLITAENTYRTVQSAYYTAIGNYRQAVFQLEHAIGAPLDTLPGTTLTAFATPRHTGATGDKNP